MYTAEVHVPAVLNPSWRAFSTPEPKSPISFCFTVQGNLKHKPRAYFYNVMTKNICCYRTTCTNSSCTGPISAGVAVKVATALQAGGAEKLPARDLPSHCHRATRRWAAPGHFHPFSFSCSPCQPLHKDCACLTQACQEDKEEQVHLSLSTALSGRGVRMNLEVVLTSFRADAFFFFFPFTDFK